jgi:diguanylate cyclase (GGDEF)-like protein
MKMIINSSSIKNEVVARTVIIDEKPDIIVNILDASNLERNLYFKILLARGGDILLVTKLRLFLLIILLIPQGVIFGMTYGSTLATDKLFSQTQALSLAIAILLALAAPGLTIECLVGKHLRNMRQFCSKVYQGNYQERLSLPNQPRDGDSEDEIIVLTRDMNWMARQIEIRENELHQRTAELENTCRQVQILAMTDPLTAIANRRCFFDTLEQQFSSILHNFRPISLLILDIDRFKTINDTYGHQAGDKVLLELAGIIEKSTRSDDLAARIGGEEYALLLPNTSSAEAVMIAYRIEKCLANHEFILDTNKPISVTVSMGICTLSQFPCLDKEKLYNYADQALYHSKHIGRNSISVYDPNTCSVGKVACR